MYIYIYVYIHICIDAYPWSKRRSVSFGLRAQFLPYSFRKDTPTFVGLILENVTYLLAFLFRKKRREYCLCIYTIGKYVWCLCQSVSKDSSPIGVHMYIHIYSLLHCYFTYMPLANKSCIRVTLVERICRVSAYTSICTHILEFTAVCNTYRYRPQSLVCVWKNSQKDLSPIGVPGNSASLRVDPVRSCVCERGNVRESAREEGKTRVAGRKRKRWAEGRGEKGERDGGRVSECVCVWVFCCHEVRAIVQRQR